MIYKCILLLCNLNLIYSYVNINIDATGLYIPYTLGALGYIKKHACINNYKLTGISGGSWSSILYHFEKDLSNHDYIWDSIIGKDDSYEIRLDKNLEEFQQLVKKNMLEKYKNINNKKIKEAPISIVVSKVENYKIINEKKSNFNNLEEL